VPWYKFHADHGPGHQSHTTHYRWYDEKLSEGGEEDEWHSLFDDLSWPIGKSTIVKKIPEDVRKRKIENCKLAIKAAKNMLKILKEE
jgi:hypothetical protein